MLEAVRDQAHGLQTWELRPLTRVLPVVASTQGEASLELLWRLEQGLHGLELPVTVLEGARGLTPADRLAGHRAVLQRWLDGTLPGGVVLLHAPLDALAVLLADSLARPLVPLTADAASLVAAYQAVKLLHQAAALQPIVLALQDPAVPAQSLEQAVHTLLATCERRLGWVPVVWPVGYDPNGNGTQVGSKAWSGWLKLLDSALILDDNDLGAHDDLCRQRSPLPADQTIGVSDVHRQRYA